MTLPLLTQDQQGMWGSRGQGVIVSIHDDVEYPPTVWVNGMEFKAADRPPFPWAGQTTTKGDT